MKKETIKIFRNLFLMFVITLLGVSALPNLIESARFWFAWSLVGLNVCLMMEVVYIMGLVKEKEKEE